MEKGHKTHRNHENLTGEHIIGDTGQLILLLIFLAVWIVDSFVISYSVFLNEAVSNFIRVPIAIIILAFAYVLSRRGLKMVFGNPNREPGVFTTGVFAIVRHPIYLASILFYLGMLLISVSLLAAGVWIIIIVFYYFISRYEERLLIGRFGKDYEEYRKKVPMLFPIKW